MSIPVVAFTAGAEFDSYDVRFLTLIVFRIGSVAFLLAVSQEGISSVSVFASVVLSLLDEIFLDYVRV